MLTPRVAHCAVRRNQTKQDWGAWSAAGKATVDTRCWRGHNDTRGPLTRGRTSARGVLLPAVWPGSEVPRSHLPPDHNVQRLFGQDSHATAASSNRCRRDPTAVLQAADHTSFHCKAPWRLVPALGGSPRVSLQAWGVLGDRRRAGEPGTGRAEDATRVLSPSMAQITGRGRRGRRSCRWSAPPGPRCPRTPRCSLTHRPR